MKIAVVVSYISPKGEYGGPTRVALGHAEALAARGHDVTVYAASPIDVASTSDVDGYRLNLYPARWVARKLGFAGLFSPELARAFKKDAPQTDVAHIHLARDLVALPVSRLARLAGVPYVAQTHGMIDASSHWLSPVVDRAGTRPALNYAQRVLTLTDQEDVDIALISPAARISHLQNGVKVEPPGDYEGRPKLVLFLARLHERKRPVTFVKMAALVAKRHPDATFALVGPDEGEGDRVASAIQSSGLGDRIRWLGPVEPSQTAHHMLASQVYVLPARNEVFPMSILEAFSAGTPVVTTSSLGIADDCIRYGAASITDGSENELAKEVCRILEDRSVALNMISGANRYLRAELDIESVVDALEGHYAEALRSPVPEDKTESA